MTANDPPTNDPSTGAPKFSDPNPESNDDVEATAEVTSGREAEPGDDPSSESMAAATLTDLRFDEEEEPSFEIDNVDSRYEIGRLLGSGGMGEVFEARDLLLDRQVAVKFVRKTAAQRAFFREAKTSGLLTHPNIPPIFDLGIDSEGRPFYVMQLIRGETFGSVLLNRSQAPERRTLPRMLAMLQRLCAALDYAHERGLVHLDVKPANIMVGEHDQLYLVDWGLASPDSDTTSQIRGTPAYMSPEQARAEAPLTGASDVFSLGCVLYEVCTQTRAFPGRSASTVLPRVRNGDFERGVEWDQVPTDLQRIVETTLSVNASDRPTARSLSDLIQQFLEGTEEAKRQLEAARAAVKSADHELSERSRLNEQIANLSEKVDHLHPESWVPADDRSEYWTAQDALRLAEAEADLALERATGFMLEAQRTGVKSEDIRSRLAEFYWERYCESEVESDPFQTQFFRSQLRSLGDENYVRRLDAGGTLVIAITGATTANLTLRQRRERGPLLEDDTVVAQHRVTRAPTRPWVTPELPVGSYELTVEAKGFRSVGVPAVALRERTDTITLDLRRDDEIGEEFLWIPAGPFTMGGDDATFESVPRRTVHVADFCLAQYPVTWTEYHEYLQARFDNDEPIDEWLPRLETEPGRPTWRVEDGEVIYTENPVVVEERKNWPIFCVTYHQAVEYCRWTSERSRFRCTLPTDAEWEKAARGVDGRWFPWGNRYDPSLCHNSSSTKEIAQPSAIGSFPPDRSPYGVRDMAGGIREWCRSWFDEKDDLRLVRGGSWNFGEIGAHCAYRVGCSPDHAYHFLGFRLAHHFGA